MTDDEIEALADRLIAIAKDAGRRMRESRGAPLATRRQAPNVDHLLRAELIVALRAAVSGDPT